MGVSHVLVLGTCLLFPSPACQIIWGILASPSITRFYFVCVRLTLTKVWRTIAWKLKVNFVYVNNCMEARETFFVLTLLCTQLQCIIYVIGCERNRGAANSAGVGRPAVKSTNIVS